MEQKEKQKLNIETEEQIKEKTKKFSIIEGSAYSVMDGAGLRNITPYALALGASNSQIGFLTSIPTLFGNLSQILTPKFMEKYSRKKILIVNVFLQALMWIPLLLIGYLFFYKGLSSGKSSILVIFFYTLLLFFGAFISPVWNSLMRDIVTHRSGNYFGKRNKIVGAIALAILLISGFVLDYFKERKILFFGFLILFGASFVARAISSYLFTKHHESELKLEKGYYFTLKQFIKKIPESNFGKFSVFVALIMFATAIASPFFSVYMLNELHFSYKIWTLIVIASSLGSLLFMQLWGRFADRFGNLKVVEITGMYIPFVPLIWLLSPLVARFNPSLLIVYLFIMEFISGIMWAGFNLSSVNFIYDAATRQRVALCIAYFNILSGIGVFIGATFGGFITSINYHFFGLSPLLFIFLLSFVMRISAYIFMMSKIKEVREVEKYEHNILKKHFKDKILYITEKFTRPRPT